MLSSLRMPIKRSRTATSCDQLENEANEFWPAEQSSSVTGHRNKAARTSKTMKNASNPPVPPPEPRHRRKPLQIRFKEGGGFTVHPATFLDSCNYCSEPIQSKKDRFMNGGLEAYCSPECRENFNEVMQMEAEASASASMDMEEDVMDMKMGD